MDRMDENDTLLSDPEAPFRFHFGAQRKSKWRSFTSFTGFCIKVLKLFIFLAIGTPPSLVRLRPRKLPGRFIMSSYRILFISTILCGVVAAALGLVGQTGSSAWVAIAGSGIMAMILFLLKEHRDAFPDFAPWLFETDHKAECAALALVIVQIGIAQLPVYILYTIKKNVSGFKWTEDFASLLILNASYGLMAFGWLGLSALKLEELHNPFSILFVEEIVVLVPRLFVPLIGLVVVKLESPVLPVFGLCLVLGNFMIFTPVLAAHLNRRFKDILSRAAASYASTFEVEHVAGSIYGPLYFFDGEF